MSSPGKTPSLDAVSDPVSSSFIVNASGEIETDAYADPSVAGIRQEITVPSAEDMMQAITGETKIQEPLINPDDHSPVDDLPTDALSVVSDVGALRGRIGELEEEIRAMKKRESSLVDSMQNLRVDVTTLSTLLKELVRTEKRREHLETALELDSSTRAADPGVGDIGSISATLEQVTRDLAHRSAPTSTLDALTSIEQKGESATGRTVYRRRQI